jgi:uncharacterized membrane protein YphA (DoxX/SURF4 family)
VRGGPNARAPHTICAPLCSRETCSVAVATTSIHTIQATRVLAWLDDFPYRPEVLYVLILVWLIFSGPGRYSIDGLASSASVPEQCH